MKGASGTKKSVINEAEKGKEEGRRKIMNNILDGLILK